MPPLDRSRLRILQQFYRQQRRLPSYSEMLPLFGVKSKQAVARIVHRFITAGLLQRDSAGKIIPTKHWLGVKVLGSVAAGFPSPAEEEVADTTSLDDYLLTNPQASFMLRISGDSMIDAGILPGDLVVVERGKTAKAGDIVIAQVDGAWTVKTLQYKNKKPILVAANAKYKPIHPTSQLTIDGVVTAVVRKYK